MMVDRPRANTLGIIYKDGRILAEKLSGKHSKGEGVFYRPLGGTIELGETSIDALKREFMEEIGAEINIVNYIACIENIYSINGITRHELTQLYEAELVNESLYEKESIPVNENGRKSEAKWIPVISFIDEREVLFPAGLENYLIRFL
ncbi:MULTISPECIES: NUDIX hydrolase [Bacillaceae]|uniref:NUDIX hydrolase n=1 Tax=Bacillus infantis TaxID=324767 RepID=A0A5D4SSH0_9BACI|nr:MULTISPECIES: NUDIX hydrolase [Bacillus]MCA1034860.1 NUDIX hydrolase [Bacillus infantis]MCK6205358.1 NUDIX hydrolase [Bacillus infantis]MCP1158541.1 NUDIX hydrolase [Bacillus infantis]MDW2878910.1 NUDIX hydrolase [Bacillus infantis]PLR74575.1 DNA mismatch repair protein MutT [Bacillus sp. UMB0728]